MSKKQIIIKLTPQQTKNLKSYFVLLIMIGFGYVVKGTLGMSLIPFFLINVFYMVVTITLFKALDEKDCKVQVSEKLYDAVDSLNDVRVSMDQIQSDYDAMTDMAMEEAKYEHYWSTFKKALLMSTNKDQGEQLLKYMNEIEKICDKEIDEFLKEKGINK